jgi:uncharacterized protein with NRDE domain
MSTLSLDEQELIDQLYFVTSYKDLQTDSAGDETLRGLIRQGFVKQMEASSGDYQDRFEPNLDQLEGFYYLATKKGLFAHNGVDL